MYNFMCKTHPVRVRNDSGTFFTLIGLTEHDAGRISSLTRGNDVSMRHSYLGQARSLGNGKCTKSENRKISDFGGKSDFHTTLAKFSRPPYMFGPKKCFFENFERQTFLKK